MYKSRRLPEVALYFRLWFIAHLFISTDSIPSLPPSHVWETSRAAHASLFPRTFPLARDASGQDESEVWTHLCCSHLNWLTLNSELCRMSCGYRQEGGEATKGLCAKLSVNLPENFDAHKKQKWGEGCIIRRAANIQPYICFTCYLLPKRMAVFKARA